MGKHSDDNNSPNVAEPDDYELKVLINKCNVCHSNSDDRRLCKHHGENQPAVTSPLPNLVTVAAERISS
jgi:hypothetical protein